jgi:hypothetical protein
MQLPVMGWIGSNEVDSMCEIAVAVWFDIGLLFRNFLASSEEEHKNHTFEYPGTYVWSLYLPNMKRECWTVIFVNKMQMVKKGKLSL